MLYPIKIEFKDYPSGSWQDWSEYLSQPPRISKKIESEIKGQAGVIVFDDASVSFRYESGSPVYNAFSIDLTSKQRYLFRISAPKTDTSFIQLFEGVADFSTLKWNEFNNIIEFSIVDKLSALNLLKKTTLRGSSKNILYDRNTDTSVNKISINTGAADTPDHHKWFNYYYQQDTLLKPTIESNTPLLGEIIQSPFDGTSLSIIKYKAKKVGDNLSTDPMYFDVLTTDTTYPKTSGNQKSVYNLFYYINEIYGVDLLVKQYRTDYKIYYKDAGNTIEIALQPGYEVIGYDALRLIDALVKSVWPEIIIIKKPSDLEFILPLDYFLQLVNEDLFGKEPLEALKMIADSMKCYIFIDRLGNLIIQSKSSLDTSGQTRSIGNTKIISGPEKNYSWDKIADGANIQALSWVKDNTTGEFLKGIADITKQETGFSLTGKIKPKNPIKRDLIVGDPNITTQEALNTYAANEALSILNFYGKRHSNFDLTLNLDDNTIDWELIDILTLDSLTTFFTKLEFDLDERTVKLEAVEVAGHDYDFRQLIFGSAEGSSTSLSTYSQSGGGTYYSGFTPIFNLPLQMSGGIVSLLITDNLKLTSDTLDTAQPIKTTDTPTFNQVILSNAGSLTQAVRGDRSISTSYPLIGGGDLTANRTISLGYNTTNLKLTSNALNTIQDIATTSTPTFNQINLTVDGTSTQAVRGGRTISTSAPLTGGGDLTANRTLSLSYNSTNLKLTSNALNTIQDIATTSSPTFANLTLNGEITVNGTGLSLFSSDISQSGNKSIYNAFTSGWAGAGWRLDYGLTTTNKSHLELDNLTVRGSMRVYELIINQIRATNGSLFVSSSAKVKSVSMGTIGDISITFDDPTGNNLLPFAINDILLMQRVNIGGNTVVKKIALRIVEISGTIVECNYLYQVPALTVPAAGDDFVRIGNYSDINRQGSIYITADDVTAPYIDIIDNITQWIDWGNSSKTKVRLGKLTGITDANFGALSGYGLYSNNVYLTGKIFTLAGGNLAGWEINTSSISKSYTNPVTYEIHAVTLNAASNKLGLHVGIDVEYLNDLRYLSVGTILTGTGTVTTDYGIAFKSFGNGTLFELSTAQNIIAGWNFDYNRLYHGGLSGSSYAGIELNATSNFINLNKDATNYIKTYYASATDWGIKGVNNGNTLFQLGYVNKIAGWNFDATKLTIGTATLGISFNTSSTPFITGASAKGFEIYNYTDPKLFIGKKDGNFLDWNITTANTLTICGEIKSSRFSTTTGFGGNYDYAVIDSDSNGYFLKIQNYTDSNNTMHVLIQPNGTTSLMSLYKKTSGSAQTINFDYYNSRLGININGSYAMRFRGNLTSAPTTDLRDGDVYNFSTTNTIWMYVNGVWRALN